MYRGVNINSVLRRRSCYLQAAQADHAVHHLGDAETVAEVVEGVVLVVVVDTQLDGRRRRRVESCMCPWQT